VTTDVIEKDVTSIIEVARVMIAIIVVRPTFPRTHPSRIKRITPIIWRMHGINTPVIVPSCAEDFGSEHFPNNCVIGRVKVCITDIIPQIIEEYNTSNLPNIQVNIN